MVTIDEELAARTGLTRGEQWLTVRGWRVRPTGAEDSGTALCRTE